MLFAALAVGLVLLYVWSIYNSLVTLKTRIKASIQEIGNQLKRQADLIPNLVASVKGYMKHEQDVFDKITSARKAVMDAVEKGSAKNLVEASSQMLQALAPIRAVFESTPQLQAVGPTQNLMMELRDTADKVMYARRTLIDLVADFNIKLQVYPSNLVAKLFGFKEEEGLVMPSDGEFTSVSKEETESPKVAL